MSRPLPFQATLSAAGLSCAAEEDMGMPDPWAHRSLGMRCRTCMWWVEKPRANPGLDAPQLGRCRRHAPSWCGDHKLDESKV